MKQYIFLAMVFFMNSASIFAKDGVIPLNAKKSHLIIFTSPDLPNLDFIDANSAEVKIQLNHDGLFVGKRIVCSWPGGRYSSKQEPNMVLGYSATPGDSSSSNTNTIYKPCPSEVPVKSTWGDGGNGTAALYIEIEKVANDTAIVKYKSEFLRLDLSKLKGRFKVLPVGSLSNQSSD